MTPVWANVSVPVAVSGNSSGEGAEADPADTAVVGGVVGIAVVEGTAGNCLAIVSGDGGGVWLTVCARAAVAAKASGTERQNRKVRAV